jgi:hypothetical protein
MEWNSHSHSQYDYEIEQQQQKAWTFTYDDDMLLHFKDEKHKAMSELDDMLKDQGHEVHISGYEPIFFSWQDKYNQGQNRKKEGSVNRLRAVVPSFRPTAEVRQKPAKNRHHFVHNNKIRYVNADDQEEGKSSIYAAKREAFEREVLGIKPRLARTAPLTGSYMRGKRSTANLKRRPHKVEVALKQEKEAHLQARRDRLYAQGPFTVNENGKVYTWDIHGRRFENAELQRQYQEEENLRLKREAQEEQRRTDVVKVTVNVAEMNVIHDVHESFTQRKERETIDRLISSGWQPAKFPESTLLLLGNDEEFDFESSLTVPVDCVVMWPELMQLDFNEVMCTIEYCCECAEHNLSTHHNERQYLHVANTIRNVISEACSNYRVKCSVALKPRSVWGKPRIPYIRREPVFGVDYRSRIGALEVQMGVRTGGKSVFHVLHSKLISGCWPQSEVLRDRADTILKVPPSPPPSLLSFLSPSLFPFRSQLVLCHWVQPSHLFGPLTSSLFSFFPFLVSRVVSRVDGKSPFPRGKPLHTGTQAHCLRQLLHWHGDA